MQCLKIQNKNILLAGIYRTPNFNNTEFLDRLNRLIEILLHKEKYLVIAGDININVLEESSTSKELKYILAHHGMKHLVDFPTRVTHNTSSCLDNFLTNINKKHVMVSGIVTALSDHDGQILELSEFSKNCPTVHNNNRLSFTGRTFSDNNMELLKSLLQNEHCMSVYCAPVEEKYDIFNGIFMNYFNSTFPKVLKRTNTRRHNWISHDIKSKKNEILELKNLAKRTKSQYFCNKLKNKNKQYKNLLINTKKDFFNKKIKNSNSVCKTTWDIINKETGKRKQTFKNNITINNGKGQTSNPIHVSNAF